MRKKLNFNELDLVSGGIAPDFNLLEHSWDEQKNSEHKVSRHNIRSPLSNCIMENQFIPNDFPNHPGDLIPQIKSCTFEGNKTTAEGGAVSCH